MRKLWIGAGLLVAAGAALPAQKSAQAVMPALLRKAVEPYKFLEAVGRRAVLLGREDGTFEAWTMPVKVLRDFRLSVYFDGALEPLPLAELAQRVTVAPGHVTITHAHAAFTIRQTWVAALDQPAAAVLLDIDTTRPLRLRAAFTLEMRPMWPAAFGGQSSYFDEAEKALVATEGLRRHAVVIGSPLVARSSEQVGHQLPEGTVLLEMDITPAIARRGPVPIVIAGSGSGSEEALKLYRKTVAGFPALVDQADQYYREFRARTTQVETPDATLNQAFEWATFALDKGWQCNDGVGCGLVAGFGPSGASQRPGFAWYFGGDALMNTWSIYDYGDFSRARATLEFLRDRQRDDGKIMHELTQSAALLDWSRYPYGYYHADTTALYLFSAERYVTRSGDLDFLHRSWPSLEKAYRFCASSLDSDGLMSNRKAGAAAIETGALSGRVEKDVYLAGAWLAALDAYAKLASLSAYAEAADRARQQLQQARASLNGWFSEAKGFFPFARLTDGSVYEALSGWQAIALAHGGLDPQHAARAAAAFNRPELSTDWGVRLFATDSPSYDPLSYNDGSVWPFVTGFVMMAEYQHHRAQAAFQHLYGVAALTGFSGAGFVPEYMSGDRAQPLERAVPHQLFSSSAVIYPLISGLLGLDGDAVSRVLRFRPHMPPNWARLRFAHYRVGESMVDGEITRLKGMWRARLTVAGKPLRLHLAPALPPASTILSAQLNGNPVAARLEISDADLHAGIDTAELREADVTYRIQEGVELLPQLVAPEPGERSHAARLLDTKVEPNRIEFELAGPSGASIELQAWHGETWEREGGESIVRFPAAPSEFSRAVVVFRRR